VAGVTAATSFAGSQQGVLGCVLLSPNDCLGQCIEKLRSGVEVFYDLRHQTIYSALVQMYDHREAIDVITLQQRLKDRQLLEEIGGIPYLNALQDAVPSAANLSYYLEIGEILLVEVVRPARTWLDACMITKVGWTLTDEVSGRVAH
jgi:hypothetical protein